MAARSDEVDLVGKNFQNFVDFESFLRTHERETYTKYFRADCRTAETANKRLVDKQPAYQSAVANIPENAGHCALLIGTSDHSYWYANSCPILP